MPDAGFSIEPWHDDCQLAAGKHRDDITGIWAQQPERACDTPAALLPSSDTILRKRPIGESRTILEVKERAKEHAASYAATLVTVEKEVGTKSLRRAHSQP
jgi:hypothetical protein